AWDDGDAWEWNGASATWTRLAPVARDTSTWPLDDASGRLNILTPDPAHGLIWGMWGTRIPGHLGELWSWSPDGRAWTCRTPAQFPALGPLAPPTSTAAYDETRQRVVSLAPVSAVDPAINEVLEWDGSTGSWAVRGPTTGDEPWPSPRASTKLAWDTARE